MSALRASIDHTVTLIDELLSMRDAIPSSHEDSEQWDLFFKIVFGPQGKEKVEEALQKIGVDRFDWYDPDTSCKEDVCAYLGALEELKGRLISMIPNLKD